MSWKYQIYQDPSQKGTRGKVIPFTSDLDERRYDLIVQVDLYQGVYIVYYHIGGNPDAPIHVSTFPASHYRVYVA